MCVTDLGDLCCCCFSCCCACLTAVSAIRLVASAEIPPWVEVARVVARPDDGSGGRGSRMELRAGDEKAMAAFEANLKAFSVLSFRGAGGEWRWVRCGCMGAVGLTRMYRVCAVRGRHLSPSRRAIPRDEEAERDE